MNKEGGDSITTFLFLFRFSFWLIMSIADWLAMSVVEWKFDREKIFDFYSILCYNTRVFQLFKKFEFLLRGFRSLAIKIQTWQH